MESHIVATALVCWKHVSGSFGHPGECHRSSCPEAFPLLYFEGALLYCSSHMGQFISLNMFEHSGVVDGADKWDQAGAISPTRHARNRQAFLPQRTKEQQGDLLLGSAQYCMLLPSRLPWRYMALTSDNVRIQLTGAPWPSLSCPIDPYRVSHSHPVGTPQWTDESKELAPSKLGCCRPGDRVEFISHISLRNLT